MDTQEPMFEDEQFLKYYYRAQALNTFKLSYHAKNHLSVVRATHENI